MKSLYGPKYIYLYILDRNGTIYEKKATAIIEEKLPCKNSIIAIPQYPLDKEESKGFHISLYEGRISSKNDMKILWLFEANIDKAKDKFNSYIKAYNIMKPAKSNDLEKLVRNVKPENNIIDFEIL